MKFAIVDIETTGSKPGSGRITEIAIYLHDGIKIIDSFVSLINPECPIPPFIAKLTGINNQLVEDAPKFHEVAKKIVEITEDAVFVAHNVGFDYHFLRNEFKSFGYNYSRDYFCTLQVSRKILPGYPSYSLGNLCHTLNISIENRHRAHGDALATVKLFELLVEKTSEKFLFEEFVKNDFLNLRFPPGLDRKIIDKLPENPGVYFLHDSIGNVIYVGKSKNIRKRVLSHFRNKQNKRAFSMSSSIADISFQETGNELIALLMESEEIKSLKPFYNRKQKRNILNHGIYLNENSSGYLELLISREHSSGEHICNVDSYEEAVKLLEKLMTEFNLCEKYCGPYDTSTHCFRYAVRQCKGACVGKEDPKSYNQRVLEATTAFSFPTNNFMIIGAGRTSSEKTVIQIEQGRYKGYGFFDNESYYNDIENLIASVKPKNDNRDVNQIIQRFLKHTKQENIIHY